ncbi:MAG: pseudouridine synthase [Bryobacteraceae bacterium]|nr:pseudouridine synthase [Bryobacteraceae bacterium]
MKRYLLFHKPYDVLTQFTPEPGSAARTLKDFVRVPGVYPAGRLDRDSEGLLLLTNDGWLQHQLTDPRFAHAKTYWAQVEGLPTPEAIAQLASGVNLRDFRTRPARARLLPTAPALPPREPPIRYRAQIPTAWLELILSEGKNRQVRRMTAAVGYPTLRLVRAALGPLPLGDLAPGQYRELTVGEVRHLLDFMRR